MASSVIKIFIQNLFEKKLATSIFSIEFIPVSGGSINKTFQLTINHSQNFFCKINSLKKFPSLFIKEKNGLELLVKQNIIRTPFVIACEETETDQILILEWIEEGSKTKKFWEIFGEQLAKLHHVSNNYFGLSEDNYMGALPQQNSPSKNWTDFFIHQRLEPQIKLAVENNLLEYHHAKQFEHLYKSLPEIFPQEKPSLLHGDLWSGNFLCDENNIPQLIDPAVYYGNRHVDLAMTTLFGGFHKTFYDSYNHYFPFPQNHRQIWDVCNLYPLLIHLNLFGKSYLNDILYIIQGY